jgi:hypothetical protein
MAKHRKYHEERGRKITVHKRYPEANMSGRVERRSPLNDKLRLPKGRKK